LACGEKIPVIDHIKFGFGRAVTMAGEVMANILNALLEEIIFAEFQRVAVFPTDYEAAFKVVKDLMHQQDWHRLGCCQL
jgi:hypothetical protein